MTLPASGAISLADLRTEYVGGSSSISLGDLYRGGSNIKTKEGDNPATNLAASVPTSGTIDLADFHGTAKGFKATIDSSTTNVDVDTLFGGDYDTDYPKVVDINSGVTIGGSGDEAIDIPSGLASTLTINNAGTVIGFGGASAGAAGGHAISNAASGVTINNTGQISGGGGAGNVGGVGGNGQFSTTVNNTNVFQWTNGISGTFWMTGGRQNNGTVMYANQNLGTHTSASFSSGGFTYSRGSYQFDPQDDASAYAVNRSGSTTTSTSGGSGGSFGLGAGYNQTATNGGSGASGGTNAGAGGAGSNGAALGTAAATSTAGANGNVSNGAAGNAGGAAGAAVSGTSVTMNNTGTLHGAVA